MEWANYGILHMRIKVNWGGAQPALARGCQIPLTPAVTPIGEWWRKLPSLPTAFPLPPCPLLSLILEPKVIGATWPWLWDECDAWSLLRLPKSVHHEARAELKLYTATYIHHSSTEHITIHVVVTSPVANATVHYIHWFWFYCSKLALNKCTLQLPL